jgi:hypothetical protein
VLANCHQKLRGKKEHFCIPTTNESLEYCLQNVSTELNNIYTQYFLHLTNACVDLSNERFQKDIRESFLIVEAETRRIANDL